MINDIEKVVSCGCYNYAIVRNHPKRTSNDYVFEHRAVVENNIGRYLEDNEVVHHKNGVKKDNRIENLEVLSPSEHSKVHAADKMAIYPELTCKKCGTTFSNRHWKKSKGFCSRSCASKFNNVISNVETARVKNEYIDISCQWCGCVFKSNRPNKNRKFCSKSCSSKSMMSKRKAL